MTVETAVTVVTVILGLTELQYHDGQCNLPIGCIACAHMHCSSVFSIYSYAQYLLLGNIMLIKSPTTYYSVFLQTTTVTLCLEHAVIKLMLFCRSYSIHGHVASCQLIVYYAESNDCNKNIILHRQN